MKTMNYTKRVTIRQTKKAKAFIFNLLQAQL